MGGTHGNLQIIRVFPLWSRSERLKEFFGTKALPQTPADIQTRIDMNAFRLPGIWGHVLQVGNTESTHSSRNQTSIDGPNQEAAGNPDHDSH